MGAQWDRAGGRARVPRIADLAPSCDANNLSPSPPPLLPDLYSCPSLGPPYWIANSWSTLLSSRVFFSCVLIRPLRCLAFNTRIHLIHTIAIPFTYPRTVAYHGRTLHHIISHHKQARQRLVHCVHQSYIDVSFSSLSLFLCSTDR